MINLDDSGSIGKPQFIQRKDIIVTVLDIIKAAWIHVCKRGNVTINSHETAIAGALYHEMREERKRRGIFSDPPRIENESAERKSEHSLKPDGFIDFKMVYGWRDEEYFGIECKRVSSVTKGKDNDLATKYVTEGIMRFVKGIYSSGHDFAAMLGFVIDGQTDDCVNRIQKRINARIEEINLQENWIKEENFGQYEHLYRTRHQQKNHNNSITLLHLFVSFSSK